MCGDTCGPCTCQPLGIFHVNSVASFHPDTGFPGCSSDRDLFVDPTDPSKGYNFSSLLDALANVVAGGFTPHIITGNVPIALSASPYIGGFGFNSEPAANWTAYRAYINALAAAAVERFGVSQVRTWWWGVLTEYNNVDWYVGPPEAYFELYDTTGCALQDVLGASGVNFGAHMCTQVRATFSSRSGCRRCTHSVCPPAVLLFAAGRLAPGQDLGPPAAARSHRQRQRDVRRGGRCAASHVFHLKLVLRDGPRRAG